MILHLNAVAHLYTKITTGIILALLFLPGIAAAATGNATSAKDLIGNPFTTFNSLPDSTRNGIMLVLGLVFLGALVAVVIGILTAIGKASLGTTSQDAHSGTLRFAGIGTWGQMIGVY